MRLACMVCLLLGTVSAAVAVPQQIIFHSKPEGACVTLVGPHGDTPLGKTEQPVTIDLGAPNDMLHLRFDRPGYQPKSLVVPVANLKGQKQYAPRVELEAAGGNNGVFIGLGVVVALAGLGGAARWLRGLRDMQRTVDSSKTAAVITDRVGSQVGRYRLLQHLGEGATADVYVGMAMDRADAPEVAVKVIRSEAAGPTVVERFKREVDILETLRHPNIVHLIEWGQEGDDFYLVEELVGGGNLAERLPPRGMTVGEFLEYFRPVLEAVSFAHDRGVVHRDLKPENVLLTADHQVRLSDFGLAKAATSQHVTTSNVMGSPAYMAPEQFAGQPATPFSDQFALGVMAYELLSGQLPFVGDSVAELMARRLQDPPPLSRVRSEPLPSGLELTVLRMLNRDPQGRFPTLHHVLAALQD